MFGRIGLYIGSTSTETCRQGCDSTFLSLLSRLYSLLSCVHKKKLLKPTELQVRMYLNFALYVPVCLLLAAHPAERHTAAAFGVGGLCDAAKCFPAASDDAAPHG